MSKGGDSSSSASAQTPSQWASALSNASISAWKEADILSFSVAQLQALSPGQISNIQVPWAVPMAVWTAETLNAVPLQYWSQWGTRYLSTTSNGVTSITPLSQSSNGVASGKNNWFDDVGHNTTSNGFAFTASIVAGISNERIAQIGAGLGRNQSHAPSFATNAGYVSPSDLTAALSAATASGANMVTWHISASQTAYMFASGWADMGADFMGALTYSQLGAIAHPESALGAAQFGYLSANQLMALGQMDWSKVTSAQLNATKISVFQGLQSHILQAISAQTWAGLDQAHTTALNATDVQLLPATTIAQMNYFGYALTASVGAVLTAAQVASIPSACWAQISDSQFLNSLSTAAFQAIPVSAFASMVDAVVGSLDHVHVTALTPNQAQNYPLSKLSDASSAFYQNPNTLNFETFVAQSNVNWALAPASFIKLLTPAQLRLISPSQMSALSPTALSALTRAQTQVLSLAQIQALSASQLSAMAYISRRTDVVQQIFGASQLVQLSLSFWSNVDSNFLNALAVSAFQAITTAQLQAISAGAFANLDQAHVNALTGTQLLALTAEQVGQFSGAYLSIAFLRGVRLTAFKGLVPDQMHHLHDYLFNTVANNAFATTDPTLLRNAENQFASLLASILDSDDGREAWLQQSVTLLIQLRWLDPTAAANLSVSDVSVTYLSLNWSWMSGTFLNSISTAVFAQIRASSVAQFNLLALAELNDTHLQALTVTQAAGLSGAQLSSISNLGALSASVVQSLSAVQLAGIHQDWSQISAHFLNNLTASQWMSLPPAQFGQLTAAQLASTAIDWRLISPAQLNALSLSEFENLCTGANPAILSTTVGVLLGLGGEQMAVLAQAATHYSAVQMNTLLNRLFGAFSNEQTSRLIALMQNDTADQIVLQSGLVALLAKMDGSTDGIDAAIQTLVSLRQTQPAWFSAENLSAVLPVLSERYNDYSHQFYRGVVMPQTLFNYVFNAGIAISLRQSQIDTVLQQVHTVQTKLNNLDFLTDLQRLPQLTVANIEALIKTKFLEIVSVSPTLRNLTAQYEDARQVFTVQDAIVGDVTTLVMNPLAGARASSAQLHVNLREGGVISQQTLSRMNEIAKATLTEKLRPLVEQVVISKQPFERITQLNQRTLAVLGLGNMLIMLGAGIGELGTAIEAGLNNKLSKKERDNIIASASLNAIASVAQGLQVGTYVVLQALMRRYTRAQRPAPATDALATDALATDEIARQADEFLAPFDEMLEQQFNMLLEDEIVRIAESRVATPVELPAQEASRPVSVLEITDSSLSQTPADTPSASPEPVSRPPTPVLDLNQPVSERVFVVDRPASAADGQVLLLPDMQFGAPLAEARSRLSISEPMMNSNNNNNDADVAPRLLSVDKGLALIVFSSGEEPLALRFANFKYSGTLFPDLAGHASVSEASIREILSDYASAPADKLMSEPTFSPTGPDGKVSTVPSGIKSINTAIAKAIKTVVLYNMSGNSANDKMQMTRLSIHAAETGQRNVTLGRWVINNLDRFVYMVWHDARQAGELGVNQEVLLNKMGAMIGSLFGVPLWDAALDVQGVVNGQLGSVNQAMSDIVQRLQEHRYVNFMIEDVIAEQILNGGDLNTGALLNATLEKIRALDPSMIADAQFSIATPLIDAAKTRLGRSYAIAGVKKQWLADYQASLLHPASADQPALSELDAQFSDVLTRAGINTSTADVVRARGEVLAQLLINRVAAKNSPDQNNALVRALSLYDETYDPVLWDNLSHDVRASLGADLSLKGYALGQIEAAISEQVTAFVQKTSTMNATADQLAEGIGQQLSALADTLDLAIGRGQSKQVANLRPIMLEIINTTFVEKTVAALANRHTQALGTTGDYVNALLTRIEARHSDILVEDAFVVSPGTQQSRLHQQVVEHLETVAQPSRAASASAPSPTLRADANLSFIRPAGDLSGINPSANTNNNHNGGDLRIEFSKFVAELALGLTIRVAPDPLTEDAQATMSESALQLNIQQQEQLEGEMRADLVGLQVNDLLDNTKLVLDVLAGNSLDEYENAQQLEREITQRFLEFAGYNQLGVTSEGEPNQNIRFTTDMIAASLREALKVQLARVSAVRPGGYAQQMDTAPMPPDVPATLDKVLARLPDILPRLEEPLPEQARSLTPEIEVVRPGFNRNVLIKGVMTPAGIVDVATLPAHARQVPWATELPPRDQGILAKLKAVFTRTQPDDITVSHTVTLDMLMKFLAQLVVESTDPQVYVENPVEAYALSVRNLLSAMQDGDPELQARIGEFMAERQFERQLSVGTLSKQNAFQDIHRFSAYIILFADQHTTSGEPITLANLAGKLNWYFSAQKLVDGVQTVLHRVREAESQLTEFQPTDFESTKRFLPASLVEISVAQVQFEQFLARQIIEHVILAASDEKNTYLQAIEDVIEHIISAASDENAYLQATKDVLETVKNSADMQRQFSDFAAGQGLVIEGGVLNQNIVLRSDRLAVAIQNELIRSPDLAFGVVPTLDLPLLSIYIATSVNMQDFVGALTVQVQQAQPDRVNAENLFGGAAPDVVAPEAPPPTEHSELPPARLPTADTLRDVVINEDVADGQQDTMRRTGIARTQNRLEQLKMAAMNYGMLGFALFSSVLGIAAGIAGIVYALQSTTLSWQAKAMALAMNGVRVMSSAVMLVASGAQIASSVVKGVQAAADTASIANAGFAIGNVIGITTNIAQIGIQADTLASATDSNSRLIAGLSILDSTLQLILNTVGTIALAFGPVGMAINLVTFIISALLPSTAAIATAVEYHKSYNDLTGQGLYKEAEIMYMHWQVAAMDASPIVNWTSSIYTEEMKKAQERKMDHAWLDKSAEERLLYSLRANTALKDNFDSLRAQMYAGAAALTQPLTNLSQTLTRATMLMLSQDNLSYFEGDKLATVKLAGTLNYSTNTVSRAPKLLGANVNGQTLSLVFNQDLANLGSQLPSLSSFSVLVNGTAVAVSGLAVLNNVITLSLATAVTAGQSVTFSYSDPTAGNDAHAVQNVLGVDAASIINRSVVNLLDSDKRAPQLADAVAQDNLLTLVFDETLSTAAGKMPVRGAFSVLVNGSAVGIYNLSVHDQRVLLSLNSPIAVGATVTVSYNANYGDGALQDAAGNLVASLNAQRVENTGATSSVTASRVGWLQYDNFVASVQGTGTEAASVLNGDDYTVYANADDATSGTSRLRYLSLSNAAGEFDMLSVTRAVENNDRIWLDASNAQGVNNFAINTHDMTVWGGQGKNSYSLARPYAAQSYIVAANAWSASNNVISISGSTSDTSKKVNLDYFLSADNISGGLPVTQTAFTVLGANDGLDVVVGSGDNQSYIATSNLANIKLTGANANISVGESAQVSVGVNGRVQVDMDMWRGLNATAPVLSSTSAVNGVIKGNYGSYSLLNFAPTDSLNANFNGKLNLSYQIGHLPRLDAFSVYVGSTLVGVNSLSVNGKTLTLNLSSAVAQNEVVSVSYADVSSADDDNTLQGLTGKDVNSFSRQAVVNTTADTTAPKLAVATVQGNSLIVHFSEALQQSYQPLNSAWAVYVNGTRVAVTRVAFNDSSSLRLTLASAVAAGQTVSLNYSAASDTSVAVQDLAGNVTSSFSSASVINLANVTQAPNLRSVTANGNVLTLTFDGTVRYTLSNPSAFVVTANNTPLNISGVSVAGNSVLLSLTSAVSSGQLVEVSYNAPQQVSDATTLRDWLGNTVGSISAQVANNITGQDLTPPSLQYAIVNGTSLVLTFSETLNSQAGFTPLPSGFAINVNGKAVNVTQAVVSGATVTLSLASAANYGDTMTLSYTDLSTGNDAAVVQDLAGNDAVSFANINVINDTPDTTPPTLLSATVRGNQLSLLFSESLNASSGYLPALTSMAVTVNGVAVSISAGSVIGDTATLTLGTAVNAGDYVNFNYTAPSGNALQAFQDGAGNDVLSIANFNVTNSTGLDVTPPSLVSAQVNGTILTLTFSEALASTASFTPGASAFTVSVDGNSATVSGVRLNGTQAVLTLASAVDSTAKVIVGYVRPSTQAIQDGAQNMAASFSAQSVSNVTADTTPPSLSSASVAGAVLTLTFSENLATTPALLASASEFAVTVDGQVVDVLSAVSSGNSVSITLSKAVTASQKVSVDYTASTSGTNYLQDVANNKTANFSRTVQNSSGLASIQNATVNGTTLSMIFNQELDANSGHLPPLSAFAVKVNGVTSAVSNLAVNGHVVTLTLGAAVTAGQKVTVNYTSTDNDLTALQNRGGLDVQSFSAPYAVHNLSVAPEAATPSLSNAKVNGSTLTLTFSEALDAGVGEWWVNYLPDGQYDASGNPVVTSRVKASGFVNVLGSNNNDSFIIGDQSGLDSARQLGYVQLGNGQGVQVNYYDTSGNLFLALGNKGQANVILESGSSLQKLLTAKLVQSDADIAHYKANRDTVTLKSLSSLTAFLSGYETIDATDSTSSLTAEIGEGDHQIKLGGQTVHLEFDKAVSNTSISTRQIPNSWLDYQYFNFKGMNADGLWVGRESDGTVLFKAQWKDGTANDVLNVSYDGTLSNVVFEVGNVVSGSKTSQLRLDKLIEAMSNPAFSTDPNAASHAMTDADTSTKLYRITDIVAYSAAPQPSVSGGV